MTFVIELVTAAMVVVGATFALLAAVGIVRLPDVYSRMHAASKAGVVGSSLLLLALGIHSQHSAVFVRALAGVFFVLLTAPLAAHLLARAAYLVGYPLSNRTVLNEMADQRHGED